MFNNLSSIIITKINLLEIYIYFYQNSINISFNPYNEGGLFVITIFKKGESKLLKVLQEMSPKLKRSPCLIFSLPKTIL